MNNNIEIQGLILSFYMAPYFIANSLLILIYGNIRHLMTGFQIDGIRARGISIIVLFVFFYAIYSLLYKIPLQKHGKDNVIIIKDKLLASPFLYIFFFTIIIPKFYLYIIHGFWSLIAIVITFIICFISQYQFMKNIRKYIE
ncbi:MAG: hypothetical protein KBC90_15000 [Spirochaetes bacterium]|nr:hypothetical protein [Spirochaetota bacterium]